MGLLHRDEIEESMVELINGRYPCIVLVDPAPEMLLSPDDIEACGGDADLLVSRITEALATRA